MVYLLQLMCPHRHCVIGFASECGAEDTPRLEEHLKTMFAAAVAQKELNPWCGICGSEEMHVETKRTGFANMTEALPQLRALEAAQLVTARMVAAIKATRN